MQTLRPALRWSLAVSIAATALALWWPEQVVQPAARDRAAPTLATSAASAVPTTASVALPSRLRKPALEEAKFDPFFGVTPPALAAPLQASPAVPMSSAAPPAPAPIAPSLNYRFLGQMIDPSGRKLVYLARADAAVQVAVGSRLDEGYLVEAIDAEGVRLYYAPLNARAVIPMPPAQEGSPGR